MHSLKTRSYISAVGTDAGETSPWHCTKWWCSCTFCSIVYASLDFLSQLEKQLYQRQWCSSELNHGTKSSESVRFKLGFFSLLSRRRFLKSAEQRHICSVTFCGRRHIAREVTVSRSYYHLDVCNVQRCLAWVALMHMHKQSPKYQGKFTMKTYTPLGLWAGISGAIVFHLEIWFLLKAHLEYTLDNNIVCIFIG